jgi:hypothetical protein
MSLFARVVALDALGVLAFSGMSHALKLGRLRDDIQRQGLLPSALHARFAVTLVALELALAAVGAWAIITATSELLRLVALIVAGVYLGFAAFAAVLYRRRPDAPCGCASGSEPATVWTVVRAAILSSFAFAAAVVAEQVNLAGDLIEVAVAVLAAIALGVTLWCSPALLGGRVVVRPEASGRLTIASTPAEAA